MAVYVDDARLAFGRMKMCHMLADTDEELHAMADAIGVQRRWWQNPETMRVSGSHYDIALSKRAAAIKLGAIEVTDRQASSMNRRRAVTGQLGNPADAVEWLHQHFESVRARNAQQSAGGSSA